MTNKPGVFISHASPDKDAFVRPLAEGLLPGHFGLRQGPNGKPFIAPQLAG